MPLNCVKSEPENRPKLSLILKRMELSERSHREDSRLWYEAVAEVDVAGSERDIALAPISVTLVPDMIIILKVVLKTKKLL